MQEKVDLSLNTVCDGSLNKEFMERYPKILKALKNDEKKAVITIKIEVARLKDTEAMLRMSGSLDVKMPAATKKQSVYSLNADDFTIQSEKPKDSKAQLGVLPFKNEKQA